MNIFIGEAIKGLKAVGAKFHINNEGNIETGEDNGKFWRKKIINTVDSLGSLVSKEDVMKEIEYWRNRD